MVIHRMNSALAGEQKPFSEVKTIGERLFTTCMPCHKSPYLLWSTLVVGGT